MPPNPPVLLNAYGQPQCCEGVPPFNPPRQDCLGQWLDASQLQLADGAFVPAWPDRGPDGNAASQADVALQPLFRFAGIGGDKRAVEFTGGMFLENTQPVGSDNLTVFSVWQALGDFPHRYGVPFSWIGGPTPVNSILGYNLPFVIWFHGVVFGVPGLLRSAFLPSTGPCLVKATHLGAVNRMEMHGSMTGSAQNGAGGAGLRAYKYIGGDPDSPAIGPTGLLLGELLAYDCPLTPDETASVLFYLSSKWGVPLVP